MDKLTSWSVNVETTRNWRDCDIVIIFCPVTSRVAADVGAAMRMVTGNGERIYHGSTQNSLTMIDFNVKQHVFHVVVGQQEISGVSLFTVHR